MKQRSSVCPMKWLALMLVSLLPFSGIAAEPINGVQIPSAIDLTLPIHQKQKLHPELSDPVLGDQAQIIEWAWSPQYAEHFGLQLQQGGLPNGGLWLVGVKIERKQYRDWQRYTCHIVGLMDNKLPILTPPGDQYISHPRYDNWVGGLPGTSQIKLSKADLIDASKEVAAKYFSPGLQTWYKNPTTRQEKYPENSDGFTKYISFYRNYHPSGIAFFEIDVGCAYLGNPEKVRTEIRFPTKIDGKNDDDPKVGAVFESSAVKFDIPDNLMRRIYPYTREANDWSSCLMRRVGGKPFLLSTEAKKSKRFGNACEPIIDVQTNR